LPCPEEPSRGISRVARADPFIVAAFVVRPTRVLSKSPGRRRGKGGTRQGQGQVDGRVINFSKRRFAERSGRATKYGYREKGREKNETRGEKRVHSATRGTEEEERGSQSLSALLAIEKDRYIIERARFYRTRVRAHSSRRCRRRRRASWIRKLSKARPCAAETSRIDSRNCTRSRKNPGGVRPVHFRQFRPFRVPAERTVHARERNMLSNLAFLSGVRKEFKTGGATHWSRAQRD